MSNNNPKLTLKNFPIRYVLLLTAYILVAAFGIKVAVNLFISERYHRDAIYHETNRLLSASIKDMQKAVKHSPWEPYFKTQLAKNYETAARASIKKPKQSMLFLEKAEEVYLKLEKYNPYSPWHKSKIARLYSKKAAIDPENKEAHREKAREWMKKAVESSPTNPLFTHIFAKLLRNQGRYLQALNYYKITYTFDPDILDAKYDSALIYLAVKKTDISLELFKDIYTRNPDYKDVSKKLAKLLLTNANYKDAIPPLQKSSKKEPFDKELAYLLAISYFNTQDWPNAVTYLKQAQKLDPKNTKIPALLSQSKLNAKQNTN